MYRIIVSYKGWNNPCYRFKSRYSVTKDKFKDLFYGTLNDAIEENAPAKIKEMELEKNWERNLVDYFDKEWILKIEQYKCDGRGYIKKSPEFNWFNVFRFVKTGKFHWYD